MAGIGYSLLFIKRLFSCEKGQNPKAVRRWSMQPLSLSGERIKAENVVCCRCGKNRKAVRGRMQKVFL